MSGVNNTVPSVKGWSTLVRPKFGPGMLLQHEDLEQLHDYTRELNRLMFRSFFGCGVVCGLVVKPEQYCGKWQITVGAGLALNCSGDPIHVSKDQTIVIDPLCDPDPKTPLWVIVCPVMKCCAPRASMCPSDDDDEMMSNCTRERDGFEIRVVKQSPRCSCGCREPEDEYEPPEPSDCLCVDPGDPCYRDHYDGKCGCTCLDCTTGGCDCVLLARLDWTGDPLAWKADHGVRRFIRPVLMRDPQVQLEREARKRAVVPMQAPVPVQAPAPAPASPGPGEAGTASQPHAHDTQARAKSTRASKSSQASKSPQA